ncbi:WAT1-related protein At5g64700-like [Fagus crenata]
MLGRLVTSQEPNRIAGVDETCNYVKADFMKMPFSDNTFDAIFAIEAACHAPDVGVVISALLYYLQTWCISTKGPVFAAMFSPLLLIIVGVFSAIAFAEQIHLGSLVGASLIIAGLYCVLWAKRTDKLVIRQPENGKGIDDDKTLEISINETEMKSVTIETK